jgi:hypothetical protein
VSTKLWADPYELGDPYSTDPYDTNYELGDSYINDPLFIDPYSTGY